jgi:hypothetical protein
LGSSSPQLVWHSPLSAFCSLLEPLLQPVKNKQSDTNPEINMVKK